MSDFLWWLLLALFLLIPWYNIGGSEKENRRQRHIRSKYKKLNDAKRKEIAKLKEQLKNQQDETTANKNEL